MVFLWFSQWFLLSWNDQNISGSRKIVIRPWVLHSYCWKLNISTWPRPRRARWRPPKSTLGPGVVLATMGSTPGEITSKLTVRPWHRAWKTSETSKNWWENQGPTVNLLEDTICLPHIYHIVTTYLPILPGEIPGEITTCFGGRTIH